MTVRFQKLTDNAVLPAKAHPTDAGYDLVATSVEKDAHDIITVHSGLIFEIPKGYVGLIFPRSSVYKTGLHLTNGVGVIDAGYRGEVTAKFHVTAFTDLYEPYKVGERFAQLIIMPIPDIEPEWSDELTEGERGANGYGSTGK